MSNPVIQAFAPVGNPDANLLILGSMPGVASLTANEYYAHPRNAFWPILQAIYGGTIDTYTDKLQILKHNRIAVWDVLAQCVRPGSLDASIRRDTVVCNDFATYLEQHQFIDRIAFNGKASEQLFKKHVATSLPAIDSKEPTQSVEVRTEHALQLVPLPSSSPAMASLNLEAKIMAWRSALVRC